MIRYDSINVENPQKKIAEFNNAMKADPKYSAHVMSMVDESELNSLLAALKDTSKYHLNKLSEQHYEVLQTKLLKWPSEYMFPVVDIVRMVLMHPTSQSFFGTYERGTDFFTSIMRCLKEDSAPPLLITTLRCMCNMCDGTSTSYVINKMMKMIFDQLTNIVVHKNKNVVSSASALLLK